MKLKKKHLWIILVVIIIVVFFGFLYESGNMKDRVNDVVSHHQQQQEPTDPLIHHDTTTNTIYGQVIYGSPAPNDEEFKDSLLDYLGNNQLPEIQRDDITITSRNNYDNYEQIRLTIHCSDCKVVESFDIFLDQNYDCGIPDSSITCLFSANASVHQGNMLLKPIDNDRYKYTPRQQPPTGEDVDGHIIGIINGDNIDLQDENENPVYLNCRTPGPIHSSVYGGGSSRANVCINMETGEPIPVAGASVGSGAGGEPQSATFLNPDDPAAQQSRELCINQGSCIGNRTTTDNKDACESTEDGSVGEPGIWSHRWIEGPTAIKIINDDNIHYTEVGCVSDCLEVVWTDNNALNDPTAENLAFFGTNTNVYCSNDYYLDYPGNDSYSIQSCLVPGTPNTTLPEQGNDNPQKCKQLCSPPNTDGYVESGPRTGQIYGTVRDKYLRMPEDKLDIMKDHYPVRLREATSYESERFGDTALFFSNPQEGIQCNSNMPTTSAYVVPLPYKKINPNIGFIPCSSDEAPGSTTLIGCAESCFPPEHISPPGEVLPQTILDKHDELLAHLNDLEQPTSGDDEHFGPVVPSESADSDPVSDIWDNPPATGREICPDGWEPVSNSAEFHRCAGRPYGNGDTTDPYRGKYSFSGCFPRGDVSSTGASTTTDSGGLIKFKMTTESNSPLNELFGTINAGRITALKEKNEIHTQNLGNLVNDGSVLLDELKTPENFSFGHLLFIKDKRGVAYGNHIDLDDITYYRKTLYWDQPKWIYTIEYQINCDNDCELILESQEMAMDPGGTVPPPVIAPQPDIATAEPDEGSIQYCEENEDQCWYLGNLGDNCHEVCGSNGRTCAVPRRADSPWVHGWGIDSPDDFYSVLSSDTLTQSTPRQPERVSGGLCQRADEYGHTVGPVPESNPARGGGPGINYGVSGWPSECYYNSTYEWPEGNILQTDCSPRGDNTRRLCKCVVE
jgi:hypothetical protein